MIPSNAKLHDHIQTVLYCNWSSVLRTIVYKIGHFIIAATCVWFITGTSLYFALGDAATEPMVNGIWYLVFGIWYLVFGISF